MRIKTLFAAILAAGLLFSGCRQDEDYVLPSLKVGTESIEFGQLSTEQVVEITATREWLVRNKPDWVAIDPASGPASATPQRVTFTVLDNTGYNRAGDVLFSIGLAKASVSVAQAGAQGEKSKGTGTLADPYTPEGAREAAAALGADTESATDVYIKGKISKIANNGTFTEGGSYGNASFYVSEDGTATEEDFYCYRILYLGNKKFTSGTDIKVGDEVVICGKIVNFRGNTPETVSGKAFLYSLNGVTEGGGGGQTGTPAGTGTQADPYNAAAANAAVANLTWTSNTEYQTTEDVYVKGKICKIIDNGTFAGSGTNGNASFYISDDGATGGAEFYCYRILYLGNQKYTSGTDIKVGDEVVVYGKLMNYKGNTPETVAGKAYLYSLNGTTEGGGGQGGGGGQQTEVKAVTVAEFIAAEPSQTQKYQLTGKVTGQLNETYGNFDLEDSTGKVYVYGLTKTELGYGATNDKSFASLGIKAGDTVTLIGYRYTYKKEGQEDKVEVMYAYYVSHTSGGN